MIKFINVTFGVELWINDKFKSTLAPEQVNWFKTMFTELGHQWTHEL